MKLTTGILLMGMVAGTAWGQNLDLIENTKNTMKAVQKRKAMDTDAALGSSQGSAANPEVPASTQPAAPKRATSKMVALKAKTPAGHKKSQPKQQIAIENQMKPAEAKAAPTCGAPCRIRRNVNRAAPPRASE